MYNYIYKIKTTKRGDFFMNKKVTVIGNGVLSLSVAAQVARKGDKTFYVDLSRKDESEIENYNLNVIGAEEYSVCLNKVTPNFDSVKYADFIMITVTASNHQVVLDNILPLLHDGQTVVFFPACFGAMNFMKAIKGMNLNITVCEAVSFLYVCSQPDANTINVQAIKNSMKMSVSPEGKTDETISVLSDWFKGLIPAKNFLETSLDNMNITLHPLPVLLNIGAAETNEKEFYHYTQGVTPTVGKLMDIIDKERMNIGKALGIKLTSAYDQLVEYYGERGLPTMTEYISSAKGPYPDVKGFGLSSRYVTEDVPYLLVAASSIAKYCSVETPMIDLTIKLASMIMETDYIKTGYNFDDLSDIL